MELFAGIAQTQTLLGANGVLVKGKLDKRYLLLPIDQSKSLLERMNQSTRLKLQINAQTYHGIQFSDDTKPLSFQVKKRETQYQLTAVSDF